MKKLAAAVVLMAGVGLLAGCQESPEDKMEDARESMSEAMDNMQDAAQDVAAQEKDIAGINKERPKLGRVLH